VDNFPGSSHTQKGADSLHCGAGRAKAFSKYKRRTGKAWRFFFDKITPLFLTIIAPPPAGGGNSRAFDPSQLKIPE
jgi:hypothetical protein